MSAGRRACPTCCLQDELVCFHPASDVKNEENAAPPLLRASENATSFFQVAHCAPRPRPRHQVLGDQVAAGASAVATATSDEAGSRRRRRNEPPTTSIGRAGPDVAARTGHRRCRPSRRPAAPRAASAEGRGPPTRKNGRRADALAADEAGEAPR